jgi:hypothetical protein
LKVGKDMGFQDPWDQPEYRYVHSPLKKPDATSRTSRCGGLGERVITLIEPLYKFRTFRFIDGEELIPVNVTAMA